MLRCGFSCIRHVFVSVTIQGCCAHKARHVIISIVVHCSLCGLTGRLATACGVEIFTKSLNTIATKDTENIALLRGEFFWCFATKSCKVLA